MATVQSNTPDARIQHILIDLENVQQEAFHQPDHEFLRVHIFVGANQGKLSFDFVESTQKFGHRAQYVRVAGQGANALDFHIAFYIGVLATQDDKAFFHIISKDAGFDPLIKHLKDRRTVVRRWATLGELPPLKSMTMCPMERESQVISKLRQLGASKPSTEKSLKSWIAAFYQKALSEDEITDLVQRLIKLKYVSVTGTKLSYLLPVP
jgi:hypothetical protein